MNNKFMQQALIEAKKALKKNEVPVGAVIVKDNKIISRAYNKKENYANPMGHAEIPAIKKACKKLGNWRLDECSIYVTLEPCSMCLSALIQSRIKNIYFGARDTKSGACGGLFNLLDQKGFNHYPNVVFLKNDECAKIIKDFFNTKRKEK